MSEIVQLQNRKSQPPEQRQTPQWLACLEAANPVTMAHYPPPPDAHEQVLERMSELSAWLVAADPKAMAVALKRLSNHYPMPPMDAAEREMFWSDYRADIGHLPEDLVIEACDKWRKDPERRFFPRPCELLELVQWKYESRKRRWLNLQRWGTEHS